MNDQTAVQDTKKPHIPASAIEMHNNASNQLERIKQHPLIISNDAEYQTAGSELKAISGRLRELDAMKKTATGPLNEALKSIRNWFKVPEDQLSQLKQIYNKAMIDYDAKIEAERRAEEERRRKIAEEEARKQREEAARIAAAAEAKRKAAEEEAAKLRDQGNEELAEAIQDKANEDAAALEMQSQMNEVAASSLEQPIATVEKTKVAGVSFRETWSASIIDVKAFAGAIAAGELPEEAIQDIKPNKQGNLTNKYLNGVAKAMKANMKYAGVEAVMTKTAAS